MRFVFFLLLIRMPTPVFSQGFAFTQAQGSPITATSSILAFVPADLNNDGSLDLVVGNAYNGLLHVYLGNNTGQMISAPGSSIALNSGPIAVAAADFNSDGIIDLVTANYMSSHLTVLLGTGNGGFSPATTSVVITSALPYSVNAEDYNLDGKMDLITTSAGGNSLYLFIGMGNATFSLAAGFPKSAPGMAYDVVPGKFNTDNFPDYAFVNHTAAQVHVQLGTGTGSFSPAPGSPYSTPPGPRTIRVKDLNADGYSDMVVCMSTGSAIHVLLGTSTGSFVVAPGSPINVGMPTFMSAINDFNLDGKEDLVVASQSGKVLLLQGAGNGSFSASNTTISLGSSPHPVCSADFNADSRPDFVFGDFTGDEFYVFLNTSCNLSGSITTAFNLNGSVGFTAVATSTLPSTSYSWTFPGGSGSGGAVTNHSFEPGIHTVTLTVNNSNSSAGCTFTTSTTFTVPACNISGGIVHAIGVNGAVNFAANATGTVPGSTFLWSFGGAATTTGATTSYTFSPGIHITTLTINNNPPWQNCVASYTVALFIQYCQLSATIFQNVGKNGYVSFTASATGTMPNTTYLWQLAGNTFSAGTAASYTYPPGSYVVTLTVNNNSSHEPCSKTYTSTVIISASDFTPLGELNGSRSAILFPNPASHRVTLSLECENRTFILLDVFGRKVLQEDMRNSESVSVSELPDGIYWYFILCNDNREDVGRLVVKH